MKCFDFEGKELWSKEWVPFGRHHSRQHEPILHDGKVIVVRVKPSDLDPKSQPRAGQNLSAGTGPTGRGCMPMI